MVEINLQKVKVKVVARRISLLMQHQRILPDLKEVASQLQDETASSEYLLGAYEALIALITELENKGH